MSGELSRLDSALHATSPRAPVPARERALARAMAAFDRHHQGTDEERRHKEQVPKRGTPWKRRLAMLLPRPWYALAGSAAVLANPMEGKGRDPDPLHWRFGQASCVMMTALLLTGALVLAALSAPAATAWTAQVEFPGFEFGCQGARRA